MDELILTAKALADPTRVRILASLRGGELCVCELGDALGVTQSTLSTHLQVIREAGLVGTRKAGKWVYYSLEPASARLLDRVFAHFQAGMEKHRMLRRDTTRLAKRLAERDAGACCRGGSLRIQSPRRRPPA